MFDAIAPALRPGQPDHDVPPRRALAAAGRAGRSRSRPAPWCSTSPAAPATCASSWPPAAYRPLSVDLSLRDARRRPQRRAPGAGRHPAPAGPRRRGRRRDVRLRPAQPRRPRRVLRRAGPRRAPGRAHRAARRRPSPPNPRRCAGATASTSARSCPASAACCPTGRVPLPAQERRLPARRRPRCCARLRAAGFDDAAATPAVGRHHPARHGARGHDVVRARHPAARAATSTSTTSPAATACLFVRDGVGLAGRGVAARVPLADGRRRAGRRSSATTRSASRAAARSRSARCRSAAGAAPSWSCPRVVVGKDADGDRVDHDRSTAPTPPSGRRPRAVPAAGRRGGRLHACGPASPVEHLPRRGRARRATRSAPAGIDQGGDRPRRAGRRRPPDRRARRPPAAAGRVRLAATATRSTGFVGASPELLVARHGDVVRSHPLAGTAPRTGDPTTDARARGRAHRQHEEPGRAPGRHRRGARHAAAVVQLPRLGGRAVDRRRGQRAAPRHPHRGPAVATARRRARAGPGAVADAGARRRTRARPRSSSSPRSRASTAAATAARSAGSTPAGNGTWAVAIRCAELSTAAHGPPARRRRASSPTAIPTPSWPRPRPSSRPCSRPSSGPSRDWLLAAESYCAATPTTSERHRHLALQLRHRTGSLREVALAFGGRHADRSCR